MRTAIQKRVVDFYTREMLEKLLRDEVVVYNTFAEAKVMLEMKSVDRLLVCFAGQYKDDDAFIGLASFPQLLIGGEICLRSGHRLFSVVHMDAGSKGTHAVMVCFSEGGLERAARCFEEVLGQKSLSLCWPMGSPNGHGQPYLCKSPVSGVPVTGLPSNMTLLGYVNEPR